MVYTNELVREIDIYFASHGKALKEIYSAHRKYTNSKSKSKYFCQILRQ